MIKIGKFINDYAPIIALLVVVLIMFGSLLYIFGLSEILDKPECKELCHLSNKYYYDHFGYDDYISCWCIDKEGSMKQTIIGKVNK